MNAQITHLKPARHNSDVLRQPREAKKGMLSMTETAMAAGSDAFEQRYKRDANPSDASTKDWMCWRDGWEQVKAVADRPEAMMLEPQS